MPWQSDKWSADGIVGESLKKGRSACSLQAWQGFLHARTIVTGRVAACELPAAWVWWDSLAIHLATA